jgi:hypothetical protein
MLAFVSNSANPVTATNQQIVYSDDNFHRMRVQAPNTNAFIPAHVAPAVAPHIYRSCDNVWANHVMDANGLARYAWCNQFITQDPANRLVVRDHRIPFSEANASICNYRQGSLKNKCEDTVSNF